MICLIFLSDFADSFSLLSGTGSLPEGRLGTR